MKREDNKIAYTARSRALTDLKMMFPDEYAQLFAKHVADIVCGVAPIERKRSYGTATHVKSDTTNTCVQCGAVYPCSPARRRARRDAARVELLAQEEGDYEEI